MLAIGGACQHVPLLGSRLLMQKTTPAKSPIFLHSLFRSGSTYLFEKFRHTDQFYCYQEPCNEALIDLDTRPDGFLKSPDYDSRMLRHPTLTAPYFYEFHRIRDRLKGLFRKSFSYDEYFTGSRLPDAQKEYFDTLIEAAPRRPLLQFCRSAGRIEALKHEFGGTHIHLWREPRGQWWSYKISDYFDAATQATYNAFQLPAVLSKIRVLAGIRRFRGRSVNREIRFYRSHPMRSRESYLAFFGMWLYAFIEYERHASETICINKLNDVDYRARVTRALALAGVGRLEFNDAKLANSMFSETEACFYESIENEVAQLFCACGYAGSEVMAALSAGRTAMPPTPDSLVDTLQKEISQLRVLAFTHWDSPGACEYRIFPGALSTWRGLVRGLGNG
jgi:hypothetical protein